MAYVYKLRKEPDQLRSILRRYRTLYIGDRNARQCLNVMKNAAKLPDLLDQNLSDYWIIDVGEHAEVGFLSQECQTWWDEVEHIRQNVNPEETVLRVNLGVKIKDATIIPTEESMDVLKSHIPPEAFVFLLKNENVREQYSCFALYEHSLSTFRIYTKCDIHNITIKRRTDTILSSLRKYNTLITRLHQSVEKFSRTFSDKLNQFDLQKLEEIANSFHLSNAGLRHQSCNVYLYSTLKGYRTELINGIVRTIKNGLEYAFLADILATLTSSLEELFDVVSASLKKELAHMLSFVSNDLFTVILVTVLETLTNVVLTITYPILAVFNPVNVNDETWRKKIAGEVYTEICSHRQEIETKVSEELFSFLFSYKEELDTLKETISQLENLHIKDCKTYFTYAQFREWKDTEEEAHAIGKIVKKFDDKCLIFFGKRYGKPTIAVRCSKGRPADIASVKQKFPHADIKLIKDATKESRVINKHIEQSGYLKPEQVAEIRKAIKDESRALFKKHSNLNMISVSPVKGVGFTSGDVPRILKEQVCIVLFCSCKGVIPFEEEKFPRTLLQYRVDVREGYMFGCYSKEYNTELRLGCSIGRESLGLAGSIGPFVYENENIGFVTSRHVLFKPGECFSHIKVVQPASGDAMNMLHNRQCGIAEDVEENIDAVYVRITNRSPNNNSFPLKANGLGEPINILGPIEPSRIMANSTLVKFGRTTNLTRTVCESPIGAVMLDGKVTFYYPELEDFGARDGMIGYIIEDVFEIPNIDVSEGNPKLFFSPGDSGSAVLLANEDGNYYVVGMAIASSTSDQIQAHEEPKCYVVPITNILDKLRLELYNLHHEEMET